MWVLMPDGWKPPIGHANGSAVDAGRIGVAGQVGWNADQVFESGELMPQFEQPLANTLAVLAVPAAGPGTSAAYPPAAATGRPTWRRAASSGRSEIG